MALSDLYDATDCTCDGKRKVRKKLAMDAFRGAIYQGAIFSWVLVQVDLAEAV